VLSTLRDLEQFTQQERPQQLRDLGRLQEVLVNTCLREL